MLLLVNSLATVSKQFGKHFQTKMTQNHALEGERIHGLTRDSAVESDQGRSESREAHHSQTRGTTAGLEQDCSDQRVETHSLVG